MEHKDTANGGPQEANHEQENIQKKLESLRASVNFHSQEIKIRDDLTVSVFVNYEKVDQNGHLVVPNDKHEQENEDSDDEEEEVIDYEKDDADEVQITNKYTIDMIAQLKDEGEELFLHWGIGRKQLSEWTAPDDKFLPQETQRWPDGKACQTKFIKDSMEPVFRAINLKIQWINEIEPAVKSVNYVILEKNKNAWHNNGGRDYQLKLQIEPEQRKYKNLPLGKIGEVVQEIIECETVYNSWTLMHRYGRCKDMLAHRVDQDNRDHIAFLFIWLRYSFIKQLNWQKNYNTKPKDLQGAQVSLTDEICAQFARVHGKNKEEFLSSADILRSMLSLIGKGSGNGQRVRDEILNIMHRHKISEAGGHFYEQWHQKLHNNTTPDDITICEALLAYLKSGGNMGKYWEVLKGAGVTKERLASYERKITCEPWYKPEAIHDFENYLKILKEMHSSDDLEIISNEAKRHLGGDTVGMIDDVLRNFHDQDSLRQMERISKLRHNINQHHIDKGNKSKLKDILFLDLVLEVQLRTIADRILHIDIGFDQYIREASIILSNLALTYQWVELAYCKEDWDKLVQSLAKDMHQDNARKVKSVIDRIKQAMGEVNDSYMGIIQSKAEMLGKEFQVDEFAYNLFSQELIRGSLFFSLSMILKKIDPHIRKCSNLGDWLIISQGRSQGSRGYAEKVNHLKDVVHHEYEKRTVLLCDRISGEEEVPSNVQAIILTNGTDYPDVLAHVSVRARNLKVMLAVIFEEEKANQLLSLEGKHIFLAVDNSNIRFQEQNPNMPIGRKASSHLILQYAIDQAKDIQPPPDFEKPFMSMDEFNSENMGAKSMNLKILKDKLENSVLLPESGCIPYKMLEYSLSLEPETQKQIEKHMEELIKVTKVKKMNRLLYKCKELVLSLSYHKDDPHHKQLKEDLVNFGIPSGDLEKAWKSIKKVWASKFNERAFLATKKIGVSLKSIYMAVLVQKIIPSEYAYVIHTENPSTLDEKEVYVESCLGLGEALVSKMPGQAFSFGYNKESKETNINSYPNKPIALTSHGFMFRSDSNSEDLAGFAGAGLFDSYTMNEESRVRIAYSKEKLLTDKSFRDTFMSTLGKIGVDIENVYGEAQDIEGAYYDGKYYVVQTRPQV